jgi:precorrin-8X/cobalt-precorrin-8 methylmutase
VGKTVNDEALGAVAMAPSNYDYIRDPEEIYRRSFAVIRAEADLGGLVPDLEAVAVRLIHACGMPDLVGDLAYSTDAASQGRRALEDGAAILVDTEMVAHGVIRGRLPAANRVVCTLPREAVEKRARAGATTRSAAAVDLWLPDLAGAVVAIGNAPTALFRLMELIDAGAPHPAVVLAFPVGFVGAAESKDALVNHPAGLPFVTVRGRRGGSAMAAAAVNALSNSAP